MSELPNGWIRATLDEFGVDAQPGFASGKHNRDGDGVVHLRPMNITRDGRIDLNDVRYVADASDRRVIAGDVLFNNTNSPELVGKTALVTSVEPLAFSNHMTRLRPPEGIRSDFLAIQLHWLWMQGYFKTVLNNHVNQASVASKKLLETPIIVAPVNEQRRIVAALEEHLARLNSARSSVNAVDDRCKLLRTTVLSAAASGRLLSHAAPVNDNSSFELIKDHAFRKINYQALEPLPPTWKWRVASDVCDLITSGATPEARLMHADQGDIPFLKVYNITRDGMIDFSIRPTFIDHSTHVGKLARSRVRPRDVLTNIVGPPLGKTAIVPDLHEEWNINQAIVAFRAGLELTPEWLALVLQSPFILNKLQATARATAGQFNIALSTCRELPIPVPPIDEQRLIVTRVAEVLSISHAGRASAQAAVGRADVLRSLLFKKAFEGELAPQDFTDESASMLLERIQVGRGTKARAGRGSRTKKTAGIQGDLLS
ncbi:restriction endonuclease subunit S [Streptosporangium amethystogenes subsp. fukuiense]|uniref:Restriction endonuclease subunit S n=1 Tax=Streptosporangium amethystogenes subsp. fukuiense TaxID=698418 RepID=A0ABW2TAT3_9ACTN